MQRVPKTESQGRIHTSTATVAVMPEAEEIDVQIDPNDLQIDVYRSSGPGGQSVNTTDSAVRITHKPTGLVVVDAGREVAAPEPREGDARAARAAVRAGARRPAGALSEERRSQVGTGDRAFKIRTYNFPQDRVTDHRVNLTKGNLEGVLAGDLDEFTRRARGRREAPQARGERARRQVDRGGRRAAARGRVRHAAAGRRGAAGPRARASTAPGSSCAATIRSRRSDQARFDELLARREAREPVAYIVGRGRSATSS